MAFTVKQSLAPMPLKLSQAAQRPARSAGRRAPQPVLAANVFPTGVRLGGDKLRPQSSGWQPGQYPEPELIDECGSKFPDAGIANVEETLALLLEHGYEIVDVRSPLELEEEGVIRGSYNIPLFNTKKKYNSETEKKDVVQMPNTKFLAQVEKAFPDKAAAKLIIMCSDSKKRAIQSLMLLDEADYESIIGMRGGYNVFNFVFDNKYRRRDIGRAETVWGADGSTGIFASGVNNRANFADPGDEGFFYEGSLGDVDWGDWEELVAAGAESYIAPPKPEED